MEKLKTYWNREGKYQNEYEKLYDEFVKDEGISDHVNGELIRAVSRLQYEYYNNCNCNAQEHILIENYDQYNEDEDSWYEEDEYDIVVSDMFENFLELIEYFVPNISEITNRLRNLILIDQPRFEWQFNKDNQLIYNDLIDRVMEYILNTPTRSIPEWYLEKMD